MQGGTIAAIIIGIIVVCVFSGLLGYFVIYPAIKGDGEDQVPLTQTTPEAAAILAASAEQFANQAKLGATPQAVSQAAAQANNAAVQAQAIATALAAQHQAANTAAQQAIAAAQANPTNPELLTAQTAAIARQAAAKAAADAAAASVAKAKTHAEAANVFATQKLGQAAGQGSGVTGSGVTKPGTQQPAALKSPPPPPVLKAPTKVEEDQAAAAAAQAIAQRDAEQKAKDTTTPGSTTTPAAASTPAPAQDFTQLCKDKARGAQSFFAKKIYSDDKFLPELKKYPSGSRLIDMIRKEDVSYNPTTRECVYNIRPFGYVPQAGGPPTAEFLPRRRESIPLTTFTG
jgi:hypothetical protein